MSKALLIEIGVEELPALPFLKELPNILQKWESILQKYRLNADFELYFTPRRIVLFSQSMPLSQQSIEENLFGPPLEIAFKDGIATKAAESFAQKCGVSVGELARSNKDGKEVLYFSRTLNGESTATLLPQAVLEFINSLNFGKSMRWGSLKESFIRPVRWLGILHGDRLIEAEIFGVKSAKNTHIHRQETFKAVDYESISDFFEVLKNGGVILKQDERREKILREIREIEECKGIIVEIDEALLDEVVAITEYPSALFGSFSGHFLQLPPEVIITSMKENQRYFATYDKESLHNGFIVVSNARSENKNLIIHGNEKVLRARLSDALFFYQNDLKNGLDSSRLAEVTFVEGLGNMVQKSEREQKIALILFDIYAKRVANESGKSVDSLRVLISQSAAIAKADLMSETVYEFTELQGIIGYYLAKASAKDELLCNAMREQYLPNGEDSELPKNLFSSILALSYRLDNLMGLFSIGKIPSGSKDPFSLRRAANGLLRIVFAHHIPFDLGKILQAIAPLYREFDTALLETFIVERAEAILETNASFIRAVVAGGECDLLLLGEKVKALNALLNSSDGRALSTIFKRVANIIKGVDLGTLSLREDLLSDASEIALFEEFSRISAHEFSSVHDELSALLTLQKPLENFFENVLVNSDNIVLKTNRQTLIALIYRAFLKIADIKEISL
ncbi:MAG: glycine--tRNA ligase subunit beta [Wolinella sp.]